MTTTNSQAINAVRLTGELDPQLSRWLWLFKMLLAIPHFVILALLWVPFIITTLFAGIAILLTGRYPQKVFDFNVGVLRWNWRVGFYVYAALGTDKYPPFSLTEQADYPAHLDIDYDDHPSRGSVPLRWLMAIPHLVIVALVVGDLLSLNESTDTVAGAFSIVNVLVVIAGVFLLVTSRYPRPLFDLILGINRWVYRVAAYVAFMRAEYPPFRLDTGDADAKQC
ncbi:MAG: DUF4389 domain-containing protein [Kineosporiaceae bacterium]|nr:DUF4389 domain-containing protein [Aeromicrobium sp.]